MPEPIQGIDVDLRAFLMSDEVLGPIINDRVHKNAGPNRFKGAYIWYRRRTMRQERSLDDEPGEANFGDVFDVECVSRSADQAELMATRLRSLDSYRGSFGDGKIQALWVTDPASDFVGSGLPDDEFLHTEEVQLEVNGYREAA